MPEEQHDPIVEGRELLAAKVKALAEGRRFGSEQQAIDVWFGDNAEALLDCADALEALLDHAKRIQEHVPKSEHWYAVRDFADVSLTRLRKEAPRGEAT